MEGPFGSGRRRTKSGPKGGPLSGPTSSHPGTRFQSVCPRRFRDLKASGDYQATTRNPRSLLHRCRECPAGGTDKGNDVPSPLTGRSSEASVARTLSSFRAGSKVARKSRAASISRNDSSARSVTSTSSCGSRSTSSWACSRSGFVASDRSAASSSRSRLAFSAVSSRRRLRISAPRHADLPPPSPPGAHEGTAATALTSSSAPGTASPATRAATTGGAAPANSAAATG
jgi:hypothetical protein